MALSEDTIRQSIKRLLLSRMRILNSHSFYGLLLMHMKFAVDESTPTAWTDGTRICFGVAFLNMLSDSELDFIMMHEIMHIVLKHCERGKEYKKNSEDYNIACDIVVNSIILGECNNDLNSITIKHIPGGPDGKCKLPNKEPSMHTAPDGEEGSKHTAEEVYAMIRNRKRCRGNSGDDMAQKGSGGQGVDKITEEESDNKISEKANGDNKSWDDHSKWEELESDKNTQEMWNKRLLDAAEAMKVRKSQNARGLIPLCVERILADLKKPTVDWRIILNDFVSEEVVDYSFTPPDRRYQDSDFFLPDFNDTEAVVKNILFMIDTSGSMSDDMITQAYSEIKGAIDQFNGKLSGWLGFFDAKVVEPKPFENEQEFKVIRPKGGGGTNFDIIFDYVRKNMSEEKPSSIIILTDGIAPFPDEKKAEGIPVLWLVNNDRITPPWGRVARIK